MVEISVIVPLFNQGKYLTDCIDSVLKQKFSSYEIIIIDDCSTDNSYTIANKLKKKSVKISLYRNKKNMGVGFTRNRGIKIAKGEYIVPLDADDMLNGDYLQTVYDHRNESAIIYTDVVKFDKKKTYIKRKAEYDLDKLKTYNIFSVTCLYKKADCISVGMYDEKIVNLEDWEFALRMGMNGFYGKRIPIPLFYYRQRSGSRYREVKKNNLRPGIKTYIYKKLCLVQ